MDDLARRRATHTRVCLVRVLGKVVRNLDNPAELDTYLKCIGRLHQLAGVDQSYLILSGQAFCTALDSIEQHRDLWSRQVGRHGVGVQCSTVHCSTVQYSVHIYHFYIGDTWFLKKVYT